MLSRYATKNNSKIIELLQVQINHQGWGGPAVQYLQSTPVLGNLGPVTDWRSYFWDPGIVRTRTEDLHRVPGPPIYEDWSTGDWWSFEELPYPCQSHTFRVRARVRRESNESR